MNRIPDIDEFWQQVMLHMGDRYYPHTPASGLARFKDKLRREGFHEELAARQSPQLIASAVPWAGFLTIGGQSYLRLDWYAPVDGEFCCYTCFDKEFDLYLCLFPMVNWELDSRTEGVLARVSLERLEQLEKGEVDLLEAFTEPERETAWVVTVEDKRAISNPSVLQEQFRLKGQRLQKGPVGSRQVSAWSRFRRWLKTWFVTPFPSSWR